MSATDSIPIANRLTSYDQLDKYVAAFAQGRINLLWLIGRPGIAKTVSLRNVLGRGGCWINGGVTAFGLYRHLYLNRNRLVVIDDVDDLYRDRDAVNLLKCLCQSEPRKRLGWHTDNATLRREEIPREFDTSSRVCVIANELTATNPNVEALLDRGIVVRFDLSSEELHLRAASWFWDQEIFDFIGQRLHWIESASMRDYVLAYEMKQSGLNWRHWLFERWGLQGTKLLVAQLQSDPVLNMAERLRIFRTETSECDQTYFAEAGELGYRWRKQA